MRPVFFARSEENRDQAVVEEVEKIAQRVVVVEAAAQNGLGQILGQRPHALDQAEKIDRDARRPVAVGPVDAIDLGRREVEQARDDGERVPHGVVLDEVGLALRREAVDELVGDGRQEGLDAGVADVVDGGGAFGRLRAGLVDYLLHPQWLLDVGVGGKPHVFGNLSEYVPDATTPADFRQWVDKQFDPSVTWKDIERLRRDWDGNLVIKGVLTSEDAVAAADAGADGVVVSNHGGRQLDGVASGLAALPRIADALKGRAKVLVDGGVRSGQDVLRAVASGADAALIGRPWIYAVAAQGEAGLKRYLALVKNDLGVAMALTGVTRIGEVSGELIDGASGRTP